MQSGLQILGLGVGGGRLGVLGGQEGLEGHTSDRERYHLDREGCECIREGRGRVAGKFQDKTLPLWTWLLHLAGLCGPELYDKYEGSPGHAGQATHPPSPYTLSVCFRLAKIPSQ